MLQNINKVFRISRRKFDTFYTEIELKTTTNSGGNMYESFGWIGTGADISILTGRV